MISFLFSRTPLYFMTQTLGRDEAFSYLLAKKGVFDIITLTARDLNPPFYYLVLHYWMKIFGTSEVILRSLSLVFFAFTVYVVFLFLQNILRVPTKRIWLYLLLFASNPGLIYFAFEARMYALFALLTALSFYLFWKKHKVLYIIATTLGLYTHYFFIFVAVTQLLYLFCFERERFFHHRRSLLLPPLFFAPWLLYILPTFFKKTAQFWIIKLTLLDLVSSIGVLYTGYETMYKFYDGLIIPLSLFLFVSTIFFVYRQKKKPPLLRLLLLWSFVFYLILVVISLFLPIFVFRYLIFANLGLNLFIFYLLEHCRSKTRVILLVILFLINFHYNSLQALHRRKAELRKVFKEINLMAQPYDLVYVKEPALYFPAAYYLDEKRVYVYPDSPIPHYVGGILITDEKIAKQLPSYPQKAFILKNDRHYDVQAIR